MPNKGIEMHFEKRQLFKITHTRRWVNYNE